MSPTRPASGVLDEHAGAEPLRTRSPSLRGHPASSNSPRPPGPCRPPGGPLGVLRAPLAASGNIDPMGPRISDRIAAIAESATLAVDAKAKALKAAGRPVIGFGAGEPDFPTPDYIVEAAAAACRDPKNHRYTPVAGLPDLRAAIAAKTARDTGYRGRGGPGAGDQRRQAGGLQRLRHAARPGRRGAAGRPVLDDLPRGDQARRRRAGRGGHRRDLGLPGHRRAAGPRPDRRGPRCCCSSPRPTRRARCTRAGRSRRSAAGRGSTTSGWSPTRSTSTWCTATRRWSRSPTAPGRRCSSSTASPRPTR